MNNIKKTATESKSCAITAINHLTRFAINLLLLVAYLGILTTQLVCYPFRKLASYIETIISEHPHWYLN